MCWQHYSDSSTDVHSNLFVSSLCRHSAFSVSLPLNPSGWSLETTQHLVSEKGMQMAKQCHSPLIAHQTLLHSLTAACCVCVCVYFLFFCTDGSRRVFPACCNDIQIGRVICQVHFALGLTPGRSLHCVSRGKKRKKKKHYTSPVFTEQFHPACNAWRIELGALSSLQMWQISTVAPFDTKCGTIIELVQP